MNSLADKTALADKIERLHEASGANSLATFAQLLGVNVQTLRRAGVQGHASDRVLKRIASRFQGLSIEDLLNDEHGLPSDLRLTPGARMGGNEEDPLHEGAQLKRYLKAKGIKQAALAEQMGVTRVQMHYYLKSSRFEEHNKERILAALGVPASAVFIDTALLTQNHQRPQVNLVGLMLIRAQDRVIDADRLQDQMQKFIPAKQPERTFYVSPSLLDQSALDLVGSVAIEIVQSDRLAPTFMPGAIVLAREVDLLDAWSVATRTVALLVSGRLQVRRLISNDIRTDGTLQVGSFNEEQGSSHRISVKDIQGIFCITHILLSPA